MTRRQVALVAVLLVAVIVLVCLALPAWFWHPLGNCAGLPYKQTVACKSYNLWSGIESDASQLAQAAALITLVLGFWHRHNCHEKGCLWPVRHGKTHCPRHEKDET